MSSNAYVITYRGQADPPPQEGLSEFLCVRLIEPSLNS